MLRNMNIQESQFNFTIPQSNTISIKIKAFDNTFEVDISKENNIKLLKKKIRHITKIPIHKQRLLFKGKLLRNPDIISRININNLDAIHLISKIGDYTREHLNHYSHSQTIRYHRHIRLMPVELVDLIERIVQARRGQWISQARSSLIVFKKLITPANRPTEEQLTINLSEHKEVIMQNITQMTNMIQGCNNTENVNIKEEIESDRNVNCFDFSKRILVKGLWIDVKDTVNQWMEGQVIDIRDNQAYIHYNGWSDKWNEWIDFNSQRIMPFRSYTRQLVTNNCVSPFPNKETKTNITMTESSPKDMMAILDDAQRISAYCESLMKTISQSPLNNGKDIEKQMLDSVFHMKQLMPIMDRMGRSMIDICSFMTSAIENNQLSEIDNQLFNDASLSDIMKPKPNGMNNQMIVDQEVFRNRENNDCMNSKSNYQLVPISTPINQIDNFLKSQCRKEENEILIFRPHRSLYRFINHQSDNQYTNNSESEINQLRTELEPHRHQQISQPAQPQASQVQSHNDNANNSNFLCRKRSNGASIAETLNDESTDKDNHHKKNK